MDYNKLIEDLIKECQDKLDKGKYGKYSSVLDKLKESLNNHKMLLEISEEELKLIADEKIMIGLKGMKILLIKNINIDENEIINFIQKSIEKINVNMENDEEVKIFKQKNQRFEELLSVLSSGFSENEELILDFIKECYENNMIDMENTIKLIFYITSEKTSKMTIAVDDTKNINEVQTKDIIIAENKVDISNDLIALFARYGYDYIKLNIKTKRNLEKYAKIEHSEQILDFLKKHNLSESDLISYQGVVSKLLVFADEEVLNNIDDFISNNSCTLPTMLTFGGVFFSRTKKFQFKDKSDETYVPPKNGFCAPCGQYKSFLFCVELYKKAKNKPKDYRMTDDDFVKDNNVGMKTFFSTPQEKIERNLFLLEKYGYINQGELPNALVALAGKNTEYLLDRLIESGLYEYGKRYSSVLIENDFPYRWFKIKRAIDMKSSLYDRGGLKRVLRNDNSPSYMGITWHTDEKKQIIDQEPMEMGDLVLGGRKLPVYKREKLLPNLTSNVRDDLLPDEVALSEFDHFYKYSLFTPSDIYKYNPDGVPNKEKGLLVGAIFKMDYKGIEDSTNAEEDYYVQLLDEKYRVDDFMYSFNRAGTGVWPDVNILISRPKVVRLVNLLKQQSAWIDEKMSLLDKENLLLSVVIKDTVLSKNDLNMMRTMIRNIIVMGNKKNIGTGRGIE